jgi:hypothetical protein
MVVVILKGGFLRDAVLSWGAIDIACSKARRWS